MVPLPEGCCRVLGALLRAPRLAHEVAVPAQVDEQTALLALEVVRRRGLAASAGGVWLVTDRPEARHQVNLSRMTRALRSLSERLCQGA